MGGTTNFIFLLCLFLSEAIGLPAGQYNKAAAAKLNCYPGSRDKRCSNISSSPKYQCPPNDHECNINSNIPGIEIIQIIPSDPDSSTVGSVGSGITTTTRRPLPVMTTTQKVKPPSSVAGCPPYPILHPTGSDCKLPISQYGCKVDSQDPWCRFFQFMYLNGGIKP